MSPLRTADPGPPLSSRIVLALLVAIVVASPWPFGSAHPLAVRIVTLVVLGGTVLALLLAARATGAGAVAAVPVAPFVAVAALGALQLTPLPAPLHALLAPGSSEVWHPPEPAPAEVLGADSRPVSIDPAATWRWLGLWVGLGGLALLAAPALGRRDTASAVAWVAVAGGVLLAVYAIVARTAFGPLLYGRVPVPTVSPFGPFVSKNHFAGYASMGCLLGQGLAAGLADRESRGSGPLGWTMSSGAARVLLAAGAALAMALAVLVSQSRGGAVSLGAGLLVFHVVRGWVRRRRGRPVKGRSGSAALAAGLLLLGLAAMLPEDARSRLTGLPQAGGEASGSFRLAVWRDAFDLVPLSPWLGTGWGSFADAFPRVKSGHGELRVEHAENDYLETLTDGGAFGLVLVVLALVLPGAAVLRGLSRQDDRVLRGVGTGALAACASALVHGGFDFGLRIPSNAALFALCAAMAVGTTSPPHRARPRAALAVAALLALALAAAVARSPLSRSPAPAGDLRIGAALADPSARALRFARAESRLRAHLQARPADAEAWFLLGFVQAARGDAAQGQGLARYAQVLDPLRPGLQGSWAGTPGSAPEGR